MPAALKLHTIVQPGHRVEVSDPELPEGAEVEVTVSLQPIQDSMDAASRFGELATRWYRDTAAMSSVTQMAMHPAYQEVIGMGHAAVPLILRELQQAPNHWFWALRAITGEDPISPEQRGRVREMATAWIQWGRARGYIG